jgi:hypothetical protein
MFIINRFGNEKKYIHETRQNFKEIEVNTPLLQLNDDDTLEEYCNKVNKNFTAIGVPCYIYPQMQIDCLFSTVTACFKILYPNGDFIQT